MLQTEIINNLLNEMLPVLNAEQMHKLKNAAVRSLYGYEIHSASTEVAIHENDNYKYLKMYENYMRVEQKAEGTIYRYMKATVKFIESVKKNFRDVTSDDIAYYLAIMESQGQQSAATIDNTRKYIKGFFTWCYESELIGRDPFARIKPIKRVEKKKETLTDNEVRAMKRAAKNNIKKKAILYMLQATGVRVSECAGWNINDINFATGEVAVYGKKTREWRTVFINKKVIRILKKYLKTRDDNEEALFLNRNGQRMSEASIQAVVKSLAKHTKINKHITVHIFRKTLASFLADHGMEPTNIAHILGHKSYTTTAKYYICANMRQIMEEYNRIACGMP